MVACADVQPAAHKLVLGSGGWVLQEGDVQPWHLLLLQPSLFMFRNRRSKLRSIGPYPGVVMGALVMALVPCCVVG